MILEDSIYEMLEKKLSKKRRTTKFRLKKQIDFEIELFFKENLINIKCDVLDWWKRNKSKYPHLALVARMYLNIPSTQTTSERMFSSSGQIVTSDRVQLLCEHVKEYSFLHSNLGVK